MVSITHETVELLSAGVVSVRCYVQEYVAEGQFYLIERSISIYGRSATRVGGGCLNIYLPH